MNDMIDVAIAIFNNDEIYWYWYHHDRFPNFIGNALQACQSLEPIKMSSNILDDSASIQVICGMKGMLHLFFDFDSYPLTEKDCNENSWMLSDKNCKLKSLGFGERVWNANINENDLMPIGMDWPKTNPLNVFR